jgi:cell division protein FtsA
VLDHMPELAEEVLGMPVRRGVPHGVGGLVDVVRHPRYATGVGLVRYGLKNQDKNLFRVREENLYQKVSSRMKQWISELF